MAKKKQEPTKLNYSEIIESFNNMVRQVKSDFNYHTESMKKMEALTQDYLHKLELEELSYNERAKIATALAKARKERRVSKDIVESLRPMVTYLNEKRGTDMVRSMSEILGKIRIIEDCFEKRVYFPRVLGKEDV